MNYRNPSLLKLAREHPCVHCGQSPSSACHANWQEYGKGLGLKAHDWAVAYLCRSCHNQVDGRTGNLPEPERKAMWQRAWIKTLDLWFRAGIVDVKKGA